MDPKKSIETTPKKERLAPPVSFPSPTKAVVNRLKTQRFSRLTAEKLQKKLQEAYGRVLKDKFPLEEITNKLS